jgi:hypothetical protein
MRSAARLWVDCAGDLVRHVSKRFADDYILPYPMGDNSNA